MNRTTETPTIFDATHAAGFLPDAPPSPWIDLGWIDNFVRTSDAKIAAVSTGAPRLAQYQVRQTAGAHVSFAFEQWTKLTMALAGGAEHMNVLKPVAGAGANGSGGASGLAQAIVFGGATTNSATVVALSTVDLASYAAGSLIAVDADYAGTAGFVGSGVSAAYVKSAASVNSDVDYVRRVTFNVAMVQQVTAQALMLAQPLLAGTPVAGMKVQPLLGFVDREGGTFIQEWSALFVMSGEQGDAVFFHYPRLQAMQGAGETQVTVSRPLERMMLSASFRALPVTQGSTGILMVDLMHALTQRVDPVRATLLPDSTTNLVGKYAADAALNWSSNAGGLAAISRASYRMMSGQLMLQQIGSVTHAFSDSDGTLDLGSLTLAEARQLVNDVTVCGESEAQAYVTEVFQGDGTTTSFQLTRTPLHVSALAGSLIDDVFDGPSINPAVWQISDAGSRFTLSATGLVINGGNGLDGQTTLSTIDNTEMCGALVLTAGGVIANTGSDGYIACFYSGSILLANLFAGFHVKQSSGTTVVVPVVNGVEAGASATLVSGHAYSFRLRFHSRDTQRVLDSYYVTVSGGQEAFGGGLVGSTADLVFEVQDTTGGVNQSLNVLYDGSVTSPPEMCIVAAVNSPAFTGSVQSIALNQTGTAWVSGLQPGGSSFTRRLGAATIGADCKLATTGKLDFYPTSVPLNGELITVTYRTAGMSVARLFNAASVAAQSTAVVPGVSRWVGSVVKPTPRSSADCESAAMALLAVSTSADAGLAGTYKAWNLQQSSDVWPGDLLAIESSVLGVNANVIVRSVTLTSAAVAPELVGYSMEFANDWALDLSVKTSSAVPKTTWLPQTALAAPSALASLSSLTVSVTASQINVTAGQAAPSGGGFEVRRIDWHFGTGSDGTLVLRSSSPTFSIPREAAIEQYFVRMYDGSTPPNYSRFSNEICVSVPL